MNKRSLYSKTSIILIICMIVAIFNPITHVKAATWTDSSTGIVWTYTLSGSNATKVYTSTAGLSGTVTVPSSINDYTVTSVGYGSSSNKLINNATARANVTEVILPDTVQTIEGYAFSGNTGLTKITIPQNVTTLGAYAFQNCTSLSEITNNAKNLSSIATTAFSGVTNLNTITKGAPVQSTNIYNLVRGYSAQNIILNFNATNYTDTNPISPSIVNIVNILNIGEDVTKFSSNIYSGLNGLTQINYNATNATTLSASTYNLPSNVKVYIGENVTILPAYSFGSNNTTYYMLNRDTTLEENSITNPWSSTMYGWYNTPAHAYAVANNIPFIDYNSYGVTTENGIEWYFEKGEDDTLSIKPNLGGSSLSGDIIIPETLNGKTVTKVSNNAFENSNITSISFPDTIKEIGDSAFAGSTLPNITLPTSLTNIGNGAFAYMNNIEEITIPEGVVILNENTFNASSIKRINLPSSVISIGDNSFYNLSYLESITVAEGNTAYKDLDGILYNKDMTELLLYPKNAQMTSFSVPNTITSLYANPLNGYSPLIQNDNLTTLVIPENVSSIGRDYYGVIELYNNPNDVEITILNKDITISDYSIVGNSLTISSYSPSNAKTYAENSYINYVEYKETLYPWTILHKFNGVINEALTESGEATEGAIIDTYTDNSDDENIITNTVNFPLVVSSNIENNTAIIEYESTGFAWKAVQKTFGGETGFYAMPINSSLASGDIIIPSMVDGKEIIGVGGFAGNTQVTSINIPEGVKYISNDAFRGCTNLTTVNLPSTITQIGSFAFENTGLNQINYSTIGNIYIQIGFGVYWNTNFSNFVIPENVNYTSSGIHLVSGPNLQSFTVFNKEASFAPDSSNDESFLTNTELKDIYGAGSPNFDSVYGYSGSTAKAYALENGRTFIPLDAAPKYPGITEYYFDDINDSSKTEIIEDIEGTVISEYKDYSSDIYELSYTVNDPLIITSNPEYNVREIHYITREETSPSDPEEPTPTPTPEPENPDDGSGNPEEPVITPTPEPEDPIPTPNPNPDDGNGQETVIIGNIDDTKILISYTPIIYSECVNGELLFSDISFVNNGASYVKISISDIVNNSSMKNVLPNHFGDVSEWDRLGKKNSREYISVSLHSLSDSYSTKYTTEDIPFKYIEDSIGNIDLGILPPGGSAVYSLIAYHGKSFEEGVMVGWDIKWEFNLPE